MTDTSMKLGKIETPVNRSSSGLRDLLFDEIDRMRKGETNAKDANAIARLADQIVKTVQMELQVHEFRSRVPTAKAIADDLPSLALGKAS